MKRRAVEHFTVKLSQLGQSGIMHKLRNLGRTPRSNMNVSRSSSFLLQDADKRFAIYKKIPASKYDALQSFDILKLFTGFLIANVNCFCRSVKFSKSYMPDTWHQGDIRRVTYHAGT